MVMLRSTTLGGEGAILQVKSATMQAATPLKDFPGFRVAVLWSHTIHRQLAFSLGLSPSTVERDPKQNL